VDPVPDPPLLRKYGSAGNRTRDFWVTNEYSTENDLEGNGCNLTMMQHASTCHISLRPVRLRSKHNDIECDPVQTPTALISQKYFFTCTDVTWSFIPAPENVETEHIQ
jgi:hypothetical protein